MPPKRARRGTAKEPHSEPASDNEADGDTVPPAAKTVKTTPAATVHANADAQHTTPQAFSLQLEGRKKLSISQFKGKTLIDIREYYLDKSSGSEKPGKKGIAIPIESWEIIKSKIGEIDQAVKDLEGAAAE
ncbi:transcriptional Coactivator p15-domain-containing protein [Fimicolochytrium jonesii]|uniref:transcriptional Coactivator p15-domain-containing protein n=1 Tax=Fimicolochytrium jonesii TaxID=1396493 RepID=UPI0022FF1AED|nr:transcriptional Coactivator p15-domain-containing protein [Fimicolochytrium jonesii]KAI8821712.1 transcriptional Coactivator p15-domain-containing protein [Fimicolochytrium jonesii]